MKLLRLFTFLFLLLVDGFFFIGKFLDLKYEYEMFDEAVEGLEFVYNLTYEFGALLVVNITVFIFLYFTKK